jgi:Bifunctional DNA primase/polymerase, N-terminal/Primase C terminal 1 (PriCT-1)/AAA domain
MYGIPVMPLEPQSKKAVLKDWQIIATTDPAQLVDWNTKNPAYNCGAVGRKGGFWILDVDNPAVFATIKEETGHALDEIDTLVTKSSGEKRHLYFKHNEQSEALGNFKRTDNNGEVFSVRALNAYVVAPGSIHPDTKQPYGISKVPSAGVIPAAPDWLHQWLVPQAKIPGRPREMVQATPAVIPVHERNDALTSRAGSMRHAGFSEAAILAALQTINRTECAEPLPDKEVATIAHSVARYKPAEVKAPVGDYRKTGESQPKPELVFHLPAVDITEENDSDYVIAPLAGETDGWIPLGSVSLIGAPSGAGKSTTLYQLLLTQACKGVLFGHDTYGRTFSVMGIDRGKPAHRRTMRRMRRKVDAIPFDPMATAYDTAAVQQIVTKLEAHTPAPEVLFIEGVDMLVSENNDLRCISRFMDLLGEVAAHFHIAIVGSLGSPKIKMGQGYAAKRDNLLGSSAWARKCETVLILQFPNSDDTKGQRALFVLPRNAPVETFTLGFVDGNLEVQQPEAKDKHSAEVAREIEWFRNATPDGWTVGDLEAGLGWSYAKAYRHIQEAVAHKIICVKPGEKIKRGNRALYVWNTGEDNPKCNDRGAAASEEAEAGMF